MEAINIILEKSIHAQPYGVTNETTNKSTLVHSAEFKRVKLLIDEFIPKETGSEQQNLHNTITVLGTRGSGKTSFLLTIKSEFSKNAIGKEIQILDIIDPTLIEEKGHVFLNVISVIKDLIDKKLNSLECDPSNRPDYGRKEWRTALNKLAAGLPSIDGIGNNVMDSWQDPEFVMDSGLKAVHASQELAKNFNNFLALSLKILDKKAFLVMFDDIDVDASKGWAVLETIRKYFTGARLITIVSGDSQLYSTVVRQKKWQNFGKEILEYEGKRLGKLSVFNDMITELESQYLQKVLQPQNRIHLSTIGTSKRYGEEMKFYVYEQAITDAIENESGDEISVIYLRILRYFGINNGYQAKAYSDYLLELPLRTQVQFLKLFELKTGVYKRKDANVIPFTDIFLSDLYARSIDIHTAIRSPKNINRLVLQFLLKEKKLEELYQLQPITTEDTLNASLLTLNFLSSYNIQNDPYLIFDYFIKVGYTRNLVPLLGYRESIESTTTASIEDLCNNTVILNDNVLKDVAGKITAYVRGTINNDRLSQAGTIPLFGLASSTKKEARTTFDRIDSALANATYVEKMLAYIPLSSNQYVYKQSSLLTYSPFVLLGAIGELIRKEKSGDLENGFTELSQLRGYVMPDFVRGDNREEIENFEEDPQGFPERKDDFLIEKMFRFWINSYPKDLKVSVHLLGKIATRFFFTLTNLENNGVGQRKVLGEIFHAYIIAFMNAVLVEDCRENASELASNLSLSNTNYSDSIFVNNISKLIDADTSKVKSANLAFSQWLLACPLLVAYLDKKEIKGYIGIFSDEFLFKEPVSESKNDQSNLLFSIDLRQYLDNVLVKGKTSGSTVLKNKIFQGFAVKANKNNPRRTTKDGVSIGKLEAYSEIFQKLKEVDFDFDKLKTNEVSSDLRRELATLGIIRPSASNFVKFLEYVQKSNSL